MQEYVSEAIVLAKENRADLDHTISLFTKHYGKLRVKAKSSRKITSKLSPHLEPGNRVRARVVEKGGLQVVDALKIEKVSASPAELFYLEKILAEGEPDFKIWTALMHPKFEWVKILRFLGWDPEETLCFRCAGKTESFHTKNQEFFCKSCASRLPKNEVVYL